MRTALRSLLLLPLLAVVGCGGCGPSRPVPTGGVVMIDAPAASLDAGGATFVQLAMNVWTDEFRIRTGEKVKINYQGTGSSDGVKKMTSKELAFGCSDAPMTKKELDTATDKHGPVLHIPMVVGAVVPMYNLDVDKPLVFTGGVLADIFLGKIKTWNDTAIADLNPGVTLPAVAITPVFRSGGSGTSYIFTDYLSKASGEFKSKVGAVKEFPSTMAGVGMKGNEGVAEHVNKVKGALGYVELTFALDTKAKYGSVKNKGGKAVLADLASITAAAAAGMTQAQTGEYALHELTYNLTDTAGPDAYPIAAVSYCLLYKKQPKDKGKALVAFLKWATSAEGQELSETRNYARLPADLQAKIAEKLTTVEFE